MTLIRFRTLAPMLALILLISGAYGIELSVSGTGSGGSQSGFSTGISAPDLSAVSGNVQVNGGKITPEVSMTNGIWDPESGSGSFSAYHYVTDSSGNKVDISTEIVDASNFWWGDYLAPGEGYQGLANPIIAAQWVKANAQSIKCSASADSPTGSHAEVSVDAEGSAGLSGSNIYTGPGVGSSDLFYQWAQVQDNEASAFQNGYVSGNVVTVDGKASDGIRSNDLNLVASSGGAWYGQTLAQSNGPHGKPSVIDEPISGPWGYRGAFGSTIQLEDTRKVGTTGKKVTLTSTNGYLNKPSMVSEDTGTPIQDMVNIADSNNKIKVGTGTYNELVSIPATLYNLWITGEKMPTVSGAGLGGSVFTVASGADVKLTGLTITGGAATNGGGINNAGTLGVTDCVIRDNTATNNGGGIHNTGWATVTRTTLTSNVATGMGGAIYNEHDATLTVNRGQVGTVSNPNRAASGAGIANYGTTNVYGSNVVGNIATDPVGGSGGGLFSLGSLTVGDYSDPYYGTMHSTISNNQAAYGAGVFNYGGTSTITNTNMLSNAATQEGGAIYNYNQYSATVNLYGSQVGTVYNPNTAPAGAGISNLGTTNIYGSNIEGNIATNTGGGILNKYLLYVQDDPYTGTHSTICSNQAQNGAGVYNYAGSSNIYNANMNSNIATQEGGAIYNANGATLYAYGSQVGTISNPNTAASGAGIANYGSTTIDWSHIAGNIATDIGGGILNKNYLLVQSTSDILNNQAQNGAGIYNYAGTSDTWYANIDSNVATQEGGAIYNANGATVNVNFGHVGANTAASGAGIANHGTANVNGVTVNGNIATNNGGGILNTDSLTVQPWAWYWWYTPIISNNQAANGAGIYNNGGTTNIYSATMNSNVATQKGGAVYNDAGHSSISSTAMFSNSAPLEGGAIYNTGTLDLSSSQIGTNTAASGAGIANYGTANINSANIDGNIATNIGGGILNKNYLSAQSSTISNSQATNGAGIYNYAGSTADLYGSSMISNVATQEGGAIYNANGATLTSTGDQIGTVSNPNRAVSGAGIANYGSTTVQGSNIVGNIATNIGGGILNKNSLTTTAWNWWWQYATISNNQAKNGAGIYNFAGTSDISYTNIASNTANQVSGTGGEGGGIYNANGATLNANNGAVISNNEAKAGTYGGGGGIANYGTANVLSGASISGNIANSGLGGGILNSNNLAVDGSWITSNSALYGGALFNKASATITNSQLYSNTATRLGGAIENKQGATITIGTSYLYGNTAGWDGGALANYGTATVTASTINGNTARNGGGVFNYMGTTTLTGVDISSNTANVVSGVGGEGGGAYNYNGATLNVNGGTISNNEAKAGTSGGGGGIANYGTANVLNGAVINGNNRANSGLGGGILNSNRLTVDSSTISGNSALYGGALFNKATATITNSELYSNYATRLGGAIENKQGATITIEDSRINSNTAGWDGGALANYGTATVRNTGTRPMTATISWNTARNGGGVFNYMGTTTLTGVDISYNNANQNGGGVYNYNTGTLWMTSNNIHDNSANLPGGSYRGGGLYNLGTLHETGDIYTSNHPDDHYP